MNQQAARRSARLTCGPCQVHTLNGGRDCEFHITVNAILPGATVTEVARETVSPEQMKAMIQSRCIKRPQEVSDLTGVVGFLCSKEADFITGQSFVVDGGLTVT